MDKILFVATVEGHIKAFHLPYLKYFHESGYEVHAACSGGGGIPFCHVRHSVPFERSPFSVNNIKAYFLLKSIIKRGGFRLIHCHTPVGGMIGRLAAAGARRRGTKVLYTAHGFHFYRGAPVLNWLIFYPLEKLMSRFTDVLITINREDYKTAVNKRFKAGEIKKIDGVGIDMGKFRVSVKQKDDFVLLCVGELSKSKNQSLLLDMMTYLPPCVKLLFAGEGPAERFLRQKAEKLGVNAEFLGYREDIPKLLAGADIAVSASLREGLPLNILEAMSCGKPVVVSDIRGHRDLVKHGVNGLLVKQGFPKELALAIKMLYNDESARRSFGQAGAEMSKAYSLDRIMPQMREIYSSLLK